MRVLGRHDCGIAHVQEDKQMHSLKNLTGRIFIGVLICASIAASVSIFGFWRGFFQSDLYHGSASSPEVGAVIFTILTWYFFFFVLLLLGFICWVVIDICKICYERFFLSALPAISRK